MKSSLTCDVKAEPLPVIKRPGKLALKFSSQTRNQVFSVERQTGSAETRQLQTIFV